MGGVFHIGSFSALGKRNGLMVQIQTSISTVALLRENCSVYKYSTESLIFFWSLYNSVVTNWSIPINWSIEESLTVDLRSTEIDC